MRGSMDKIDIPNIIEKSIHDYINEPSTLSYDERVALWDFYDKWLPICNYVNLLKVTHSGALNSIYYEVRRGYPLTYQSFTSLNAWITEYNRYLISLHDFLLMICIDSESITENELREFLGDMEYAIDILPRRLKYITKYCLTSKKRDIAIENIERRILVGKLTQGYKK